MDDWRELDEFDAADVQRAIIEAMRA